MQVSFIVTNVQSPLIGLPDLDMVTLHAGSDPYIEQSGNSEQLIRIGSHLHVATLVLPGLHNPEVRVDQSVRTRKTSTRQSQLVTGHVEELSSQA
eukprot:1001858-Amphidinium_carterae.3